MLHQRPRLNLTTTVDVETAERFEALARFQNKSLSRALRDIVALAIARPELVTRRTPEHSEA